MLLTNVVKTTLVKMMYLCNDLLFALNRCFHRTWHPLPLTKVLAVSPSADKDRHWLIWCCCLQSEQTSTSSSFCNEFLVIQRIVSHNSTVYSWILNVDSPRLTSRFFRPHGKKRREQLRVVVRAPLRGTFHNFQKCLWHFYVISGTCWLEQKYNK